MINLAIYYRNGEGTEKNLEKAFYWHQKVAESNKVISENKVESCNLCKHPYNDDQWLNFVCKHPYDDNQRCLKCNDFAICYLTGEGTEKKVLAESNKVNSENKVELCNDCKQPYDDYQWCQQCNTKHFQQDFSKWTSRNEFIDKFIQEAQTNAKNSYEILEWIPYNELLNINYHNKGGFSEIHKAIWSDGPIFGWNFDEQQWNRQKNYEVILKTLNNSSSLGSKFLDEWKYHYNCQKKSFSKFIQFFGITQDPSNLNYIIVMSYAKKGSLRKCLSDVIKFKWQVKLQLLKKIILALKVIHESNLTHGDFHDGNILMSDNYNEIFIIDLGLCKPINNSRDSDNNDNKIYGVLPYMAPEILRNNPYIPASDVYSLSMIMWELASGIPPFKNKAHDFELILSICEGERPEIIESTPKCYVELMKKCWDTNPSNRPTITTIEYIISEWTECVDNFYMLNRDGDYKYESYNLDNQSKYIMLEFAEANKALVQEQVNTSAIIQYHTQEYYTSRVLTGLLDRGKSEGSECRIED
ncbi:unnamed protein product [Rhizophagus irregularis]|nr:unnamed protein product [Rhizophagus irregularis]